VRSQRLPRLVGPSRAKDIIFSGRFVKADEALSIGLVDKILPAGEVYTTAVETARRYAKGPLAALRAAKVAVNWGGRGDFRSGMVLEREGMRSFVEKGPGQATFTGR